jgi:hypothetical protein
MRRKAYDVLTMGQELLFDLITMFLAVAIPTAFALLAQYLFGATWLSCLIYAYLAWKMLGVMAKMDVYFSSIANGIRQNLPPGAKLKSFRILEVNEKTCKVDIKADVPVGKEPRDDA